MRHGTIYQIPMELELLIFSTVTIQQIPVCLLISQNLHKSISTEVTTDTTTLLFIYFYILFIYFSEGRQLGINQLPFGDCFNYSLSLHCYTGLIERSWLHKVRDMTVLLNWKWLYHGFERILNH